MEENYIQELKQEIQWIRKLLLLQTLAVGLNQKQISAALEVSESTVSRMLPKGFATNFKSAKKVS